MKRIITLALLCAAFVVLRAQSSVGRVSLIPRVGVSLANMTNNNIAVPDIDNGGKSSDRTLKSAYKADRKSTRLNSSHANISYAVFCLKKKKQYLASRVEHRQ